MQGFRADSPQRKYTSSWATETQYQPPQQIPHFPANERSMSALISAIQQHETPQDERKANKPSHISVVTNKLSHDNVHGSPTPLSAASLHYFSTLSAPNGQLSINQTGAQTPSYAGSIADDSHSEYSHGRDDWNDNLSSYGGTPADRSENGDYNEIEQGVESMMQDKERGRTVRDETIKSPPVTRSRHNSQAAVFADQIRASPPSSPGLKQDAARRSESVPADARRGSLAPLSIPEKPDITVVNATPTFLSQATARPPDSATDAIKGVFAPFFDGQTPVSRRPPPSQLSNSFTSEQYEQQQQEHDPRYHTRSRSQDFGQAYSQEPYLPPPVAPASVDPRELSGSPRAQSVDPYSTSSAVSDISRESEAGPSRRGSRAGWQPYDAGQRSQRQSVDYSDYAVRRSGSRADSLLSQGSYYEDYAIQQLPQAQMMTQPYYDPSAQYYDPSTAYAAPALVPDPSNGGLYLDANGQIQSAAAMMYQNMAPYQQQTKHFDPATAAAMGYADPYAATYNLGPTSHPLAPPGENPSRRRSSASSAVSDYMGPPLHFESQTTEATKAAARKRRKDPSNAKHKCHLCEETFTRAYNLRGHIRAHFGDKPFECQYPNCEKRFARAHDLKRHELLHSGVKKHTCKGCGASFGRLDALQRHHKSDAGAACAAGLADSEGTGVVL